jgi:hypothetical protein
MSKGIDDDVMLGYLADLPLTEPTDQASARIRSRAHAALKKPHHARSKLSVGAIAMNAVFVLVSSVYLAGAVGEAVRLFAWLGRATR